MIVRVQSGRIDPTPANERRRSEDPRMRTDARKLTREREQFARPTCHFSFPRRVFSHDLVVPDAVVSLGPVGRHVAPNHGAE